MMAFWGEREREENESAAYRRRLDALCFRLETVESAVAELSKRGDSIEPKKPDLDLMRIEHPHGCLYLIEAGLWIATSPECSFSHYPEFVLIPKG